jgi:hypothetical protein
MLNNEFIATLGSVAYPKKYFDVGGCTYTYNHQALNTGG